MSVSLTALSRRLHSEIEDTLHCFLSEYLSYVPAMPHFARPRNVLSYLSHRIQ